LSVGLFVRVIRRAIRSGYFYKKKNMRKNVGTTDRIVRFLIAAVFVFFLVMHKISGGWPEFLAWTLVATLVITGLDETCPLYILLGASTRRKREDISTEEK
jgi:hypothetical protein